MSLAETTQAVVSVPVSIADLVTVVYVVSVALIVVQLIVTLFQAV